MKLISIDHITKADLTIDDIYLPGHQERTNVEANIDTGKLAVMIYTVESAVPTADDDVEVTRLNIERRNWTHGLRSTYGAGCRCGPCTAAQRDYMRDYSAERRSTQREARTDEAKEEAPA